MPVLKFHQLGDHCESPLEVGYSRIVFTSKLLYHSLQVGISSFELILNQVGTLLEIIADVAHFFPPLLFHVATLRGQCGSMCSSFSPFAVTPLPQ
jgi:hypothetical protein